LAPLPLWMPIACGSMVLSIEIFFIFRSTSEK